MNEDEVVNWWHDPDVVTWEKVSHGSLVRMVKKLLDLSKGEVMNNQETSCGGTGVADRPILTKEWQAAEDMASALEMIDSTIPSSNRSIRIEQAISAAKRFRAVCNHGEAVPQAVEQAQRSLRAECNPAPRPINILAEAHNIVNGRRLQDYGTPERQFEKIAALWSSFMGVYFAPWQVAACQILLKLAREENAHKEDNLTDVCGYAYLLNELRS